MMEENKKSGFLTQGLVLAVASVIVRLIGLLYRIPLTNTIGDNGNGAYSNAFEVYNIALLLSTYSIPTAISKLISEREDKKQFRNSAKLLKTGLILAGGIGFCASFILFAGADLIAKYIYKEADCATAIPLRVLAPTIFVFSMMGVIRGYFQGKHTVLPTSVSQIAEQVVNAVVSVVAAKIFMKVYANSAKVSAYGAAGGTLGTLCGALTAFLFLVFLLVIYSPYIKKRVRKDRTDSYEDSRTLIKIILLTMLPIVLNQTIYSISSFLDGVLLNQIFSAKGWSDDARRIVLGRYSTKFRLLTNVPIAVASAIGMAIIPSVVRANISGDRDNLHDKISQAVKLNMMIAFPSAVGMEVFASPIMQMIFKDSGDALKMTSTMMYIGAVSIIFFSYSTTTNSILQGISRLYTPMIHGAISLGIYVVLNALLLQFSPFGVYSLVIGNTVFPLIICVLNWISLRKYTGYVQEIDRTFIRIGCSSLMMGVLSFGLYRILMLLLSRNTICLCLSILFAVAVYFIFLLVFRALSEEELKELPMGGRIVRVAKKMHLM